MKSNSHVNWAANSSEVWNLFSSNLTTLGGDPPFKATSFTSISLTNGTHSNLFVI